MLKYFSKSFFVLFLYIAFCFHALVFAKEENFVKSAQYSPIMQNLAIAQSNGDVCVYQISIIKTPFPQQPSGRFSSGGISPEFLIHTDKILKQRLHGHNSAVNTVAYSPNGLILASGGEDTNIVLWNTMTGEKITTLKGHSGAILSLAYTPDNKFLASSSTDGTIYLWNIEKSTVSQIIKQDSNSTVSSVAFSPDGKLLISGYSNNKVVIWSAHQLELPLQPIYLLNSTSPVTSVAVSPNNKYLTIATDDGNVSLIDLSSAKEIKRFKTHAPGFQTLSFSKDNNIFASAGTDEKIILFNIADNKNLNTFKTSAKQVKTISFDSANDDIYLAVASNNDVFIYNTTTGDEITKISISDQ